MKIQSAMRTMTVLAMVCNVAAWTVERTGRRAAFLSSTHNFENHNFENYNNNSTGTDWKNMVGASYQRMTDTLETAEETAAIEVETSRVSAIDEHQQVMRKSSILDENGARIFEIMKADRPGADLKKSTSPSDEFSRDWSEKAGDNEEEDNMNNDVDWSSEQEQQGGNVNAVPRDGNKLELDSTLQLNRRASPREGIKLEHILNFRGGFHDEEEPRKQSNSGGDGDLWERIMCSAIIVVAYFIEMMRMRMRMENEDEDEVIYFCRIGTNNLYFMCFEFASPFRLRTFRKHKHGRHNNTTQQPTPLPP